MIQEDLDIFVNNEFTSIATAVNGDIIKGIFDEEYLPILDETEGRNLTFTVKTVEVETKSISHGTALNIDSKSYRVIAIQPISDGKLTDLLLKLE